MAFTEVTKRSELKDRQEYSLITKKDVINRKTDSEKFYEYETAVVLDIILDDTHPIFKLNPPLIDEQNYPGTPSNTDIDYSWIGRVLVRMTHSDVGKPKETLNWAIPLGGMTELPLKNEIVYVVKYLEQFYYGRLNTRNFVNNNADFKYEKKYGLNDGLKSEGPTSTTRNSKLPDQRTDYSGALGGYFKSNDQIRAVKRYEGDTLIESRFGQSIRFSSYDNLRSNDIGDPKYSSYFGGGGNPMILIRNRQRSLSRGGVLEKNVGGIIEEDVNFDGSSIQITSGLTTSKWNVDTILVKPFQDGKNNFSENFSPNGSTPFKYPKLNDDQILVQSGRLVFSSRDNEFMAFSKKRMAFCSDDEISINSNLQSIIQSSRAIHLNSPKIFLGDYGVDEEPIMLGDSTAQWLTALIDWLKKHTHIYKHTHPRSGGPNPDKTQITPEQAELNRLRALIPELLSDRVYTVGRKTINSTNIKYPSRKLKKANIYKS